MLENALLDIEMMKGTGLVLYQPCHQDAVLLYSCKEPIVY